MSDRSKLEGMKYRGGGIYFISGIPARDLGPEDLTELSDEQIAQAQETRVDGKPLYEALRASTAPKSKTEDLVNGNDR